MKRWIGALLWGALLFSPSILAGEIPTSADQVRPLLIGAEVPAVTLTTGAGEPFDLAQAFAKQRSVVVFYRGGW